MPNLQFKITNLEFKIRSGYTLIEFLIVIGILSISLGSVFMILTSVIKGSNQANISAEVKQNGQAVMEDLERQIRTAKDIRLMQGAELTPGTMHGNSGLVLTKPTGEYVYIICDKDTAAPPTYNGWIGIFSDTSNSPPTTSASYQSLTAKTDLVSGVDIDCTSGVLGGKAFQVSPVTSSVKGVTIGFTVNQGINAPSRVDFLANVKFQTVISLRMY